MKEVIKRLRRYQLNRALIGERLITAILYKDHALATSLLSQGGDVDYQNMVGDSPLTLACKLKDTDMVNILLKNGANRDLALLHINSKGNSGAEYIKCADVDAINEEKGNAR